MGNFLLVISPSETKSEAQIHTGILSWDSKTQINSNNFDLDWGPPSDVAAVKTDDFELKWSDDEKDSEESEDGLNMKATKNDEEEVDEVDGDENEVNEQIDIMAQQLKFVACLKILMEELSTLATGFEVDGKRFLEHQINNYFNFYSIVLYDEPYIFFRIKKFKAHCKI